MDGRPALYLVPSRQNTTEGIRQIHFTIWMLEKTVELMGPGVEYVAFNMYDVSPVKPLSQDSHLDDQLCRSSKEPIYFYLPNGAYLLTSNTDSRSCHR